MKKELDDRTGQLRRIISGNRSGRTAGGSFTNAGRPATTGPIDSPRERPATPSRSKLRIYHERSGHELGF